MPPADDGAAGLGGGRQVEVDDLWRSAECEWVEKSHESPHEAVVCREVDDDRLAVIDRPTTRRHVVFVADTHRELHCSKHIWVSTRGRTTRSELAKR